MTERDTAIVSIEEQRIDERDEGLTMKEKFLRHNTG